VAHPLIGLSILVENETNWRGLATASELVTLLEGRGRWGSENTAMKIGG